MRCTRRRVLAAAPLLPVLACVRGTPPDTAVRVPLRDLAEGQRVVVPVGGAPVEVARETGGRVRALSLLCTHFGCTVAWSASDGAYVCPCHGGRFDARGRVVSGSPTRPLREVAAEVVGDHVVVKG